MNWKEEREKKLNFGHTFGPCHRKKQQGLSHGEAISAGMIIANRYAVKKGAVKRKRPGKT